MPQNAPNHDTDADLLFSKKDCVVIMGNEKIQVTIESVMGCARLQK